MAQIQETTAGLAVSDSLPESAPLPNPHDVVHLPGALFRGGAGDDAPEGCIHHGFQAQAARTPDATAVVCGDVSLSYRALNERANRLAHHLARLGVGPESRVGICLRRGPEMVAAVLAVLKAGGAYVPLDPGYPAERLEFMLADCGAAVLVTQEALRGALQPPTGVAVVTVDAADAGVDAEPADDLAGAVSSGNLAYVIYTSGSTGRPKGVGVEHGQALRYLGWAVHTYPGSSSLLHSSLSFDLTVTGLFVPLLRGGFVELVEEDAAVEGLANRLERGGRYGMLKLTPTHLQALGEQLQGRTVGGGAECVVIGGEALLGERLEPWKARLPGAVIVNEYGPTETVVGCCIQVEKLDDVRPGRVPIGRAAQGTRLHVLEDALLPSPEGEAGELYIGGAQVTRGYLGRPALTAERFVPDPFAIEPGARMYRTGDRVRRLEDGALDYLGRLDDQVKVRGFRIELGEVEEALRRAPGVTECAVVAREDGAGGTRLVGYAAGTIDPDAVRAHLGRTLPEHMVPDALVALERLPLTPNGKLDRKALPAPRPAAAQKAYVAPRTPVEEQLAAIWQEVLGIERVGVDQPFLALGGHSLRALAILVRVNRAFGVKVPLPALLRKPGTIEEVAALVEAGRAPQAADAAPAAPPVPALVRVPRDGGPFPLSYPQEAAWFFEQFAPGLRAYHAQSTIRMRGELDVVVLRRCLDEMIRRHEIFRTVFPVEDGGPVQRIQEPWAVELPVVDVSRLDEARREELVHALVQEELVKPFDTTVLPLARWTLIRRAPDDHLLTMVEHHFVHDGWSFTLFFHELRALYLAFLEGKESPLPEPAVQFADFAVWQRTWLASEAGQAKLRYWEGALAGVPPLVLPTDLPRPAAIRFLGAAERVPLTPALVERTRAFSREQGVTFFVTLMTAFQALLGRYAGQEDFCVGSALGNRADVALEGVIGMVVNTVAIRADLAGDPTVAELLRRVQSTTLRAYEHQDVPFYQVVRRVQPERSSDVLPLCQVSFSFHNASMPELTWGPLRLDFVEGHNNGSAKFDLQVVAIPRAEQGLSELDEEVVLVWEYNTDLFQRSTVQRLVAQYEALLAELIRDPARRLSQLDLLDQEERGLVLHGWNRVDAQAPGRCIHQRIAEQAARTPDAVAVVYEDESLTYRELDARADRLAHHLAGLCAGPEERVAICLERSTGMVVAMLAALKAGAAYVPLDPAYPAERLAYMLEDSGATILVTQSSLGGLLPLDRVRTVLLDGGRISAGPQGPPAVAAAAENAAYVIYTSGSTGRPKGVVVTHANAAAFFAGMDERVGGTIPGTWLAVTRVGFDIHVLELLWTLSRGFRVVVHPDLERAREDGAVARRIRRYGVTHLQCTPSLAAMTLAESGVEAFAGLERLLLGGEALPSDLAAQVSAVLPPGGLINMYGPTETTVWSTTHAVQDAGSIIPIGRPIEGTGAYVLDGAFRPAPVGVPGELYIGGAGVARGYLDRPGLTAERFVPDPFSGRPGARLYRTGDRARWREGGRLEFLGRLDAQVKIRGFRIEPGEIEAVLRRHAGVRECAVVARGDRPGQTRLAAYVVPAPEAAPAAAELRAHLRGKLPEYMVPAGFVFLDRLPLTPGGKLDRRALPAPETAGDEAGYVAPAPGTEEEVAGIWRDVLGRERVGARDDFFDLGGDSLLATRVVLRTRDLLGRHVPLVTLFDHRTLADFAAASAAAAPSAPVAGNGVAAGAAGRRASARVAARVQG